MLQSGFSTAEKITDVSGRGVGMDAVVNSIRNTLDGDVEIESELGYTETCRSTPHEECLATGPADDAPHDAIVLRIELITASSRRVRISGEKLTGRPSESQSGNFSMALTRQNPEQKPIEGNCRSGHGIQEGNPSIRAPVRLYLTAERITDVSGRGVGNGRRCQLDPQYA